MARQNAINWRATSRLDRVVVERASTMIHVTDIERALRAELGTRGLGETFEITISNRNLVIHIPADKTPDVVVTDLSLDPRSNRLTAIIAVPSDGPQPRRVNITGRVYPVLEVPVPARTLRPGQVIGDNDVEWVAIRSTELRANFITDAGNLVGQEPRRTLRAGVPVRNVDVQRPVAVAKNGAVTIVYQTPAVTLTATGRALQQGSEGDSVRVMNIQTQAVLDAVVTGTNRVEVTGGRLQARN